MTPSETFPRAAAAARNNARSRNPKPVMELPEVIQHFSAWDKQVAEQILGAK